MPTAQATDWLTTLGMAVATLCSLLACGAAFKRLIRAGSGRTFEQLATLGATLLCAAVFIYRTFAVHASWQPLQSHVDGLALLATLLGAIAVYLQWTNRLRGLDVFAQPVLFVLTLWGVCASRWTFQPFEMGGLWRVVHLLSVYLGTAALATAAAAGGLYLLIDRQLRTRDHRAWRLKLLGRLSDLETVEYAITRSAMIGFVLVTLGLITGVVIITSSSKLGPGWWYSPKVVLAAAVWLIFALVMHVRFVPTFRGRRAAVLAIVGFVLMIGAMGVSLALPGPTGTSEDDEPDYTPTVLTFNRRGAEAQRAAVENRQANSLRLCASAVILPCGGPG